MLAAQSRMVWRIAHLYYQRPSLRELIHLYANVAATSFVAGELDDLELHQMIQPVVAGTLGAVGGAIPGFQVFTTILVNSLLSGSANAFLTLRVGIIAKDYCGSLVAEPRTQVRRAATTEAARLLSGIVKESGARVREAIWKEIKQKIPRPWPLRKGSARDRLATVAGSTATSRRGTVRIRSMHTLTSQRLLLRMFRESDLDAYAEMCGDPEVMRLPGRWPSADPRRSLAEHGAGAGALAAPRLRPVGRRGARHRAAGRPGRLLAARGLARPRNRLDAPPRLLGPRLCHRGRP